MENIYNYIEKNNYEIDEINPLDALIFSRLSYLPFELFEDKIPMTIEELKDFMKDIKTNEHDIKLVNKLCKSNRFKKIKIIRSLSILDQEKEEQFLAITIQIKENVVFVSFRGTNKSLIGYKEDMDMCYRLTSSEIDALKYLKEEHANTIYLGGHSKGGHLAMYAGIHTNFLKRCYIAKIYNFDGPGFLKLNYQFNRMKGKILNFFPESSIVGRLLENNANIVAVKTKREGIEAHNLYHWLVKDKDLVEGKLTKNSDEFHIATRNIMEKIAIDRRKIIIDYFFKFIQQGKIISFKNMDFDEIKVLFNNIPEITKEEKKFLLNYIKMFIKVSLPTIKK